MEISRMKINGDVNFPRSIRDYLSLDEGDKIIFIEQDGKVIVTKPGLIAFDEFSDKICKEAV